MRLIDADGLKKSIPETTTRVDCVLNCDLMDKEYVDMLIDQAPTVDPWHYPAKGELPERREVPYQCLCKIHAVGEDENVFYAALWFDGSHFYMPDINDLYWEENDYTDITICWQYIEPPKEEA